MLHRFACRVASRAWTAQRLSQPSWVQNSTWRSFSTEAKKVRNVAIVAHVDHGKSTLVDAFLNFTNAGSDVERSMDSDPLERERGITILSKSTSLQYNDTLINIVDTPGHSDFSGEVERVLSMVDGVCLVVDATDGPMPQTKYVLSKALAKNLTPIVVINKIDRPTSRLDEVENEVFDLFCSLNANDDQLEYKTIYAIGRDGWSSETLPDDLTNLKPDMAPLLNAVIESIPAPRTETGPFRMLASIMESDPSVHLGKVLLTGRIFSGECKPGDSVRVIHPNGDVEGDVSSIVKVMKRLGTKRYEVDVGKAGDIVTLSGIVGGRATDTLASPEALESGPLPGPVLDPPTISMFFAVNDSPLAGNREQSGGSKLTSQVIKERLLKETESNIAVQVAGEAIPVDGRDCIEVHGRGEMQLGILVENMRREGFELSVSPPRALMRTVDGVLEEPIEEVTIDIGEDLAGMVIENLMNRKADMLDSIPNVDGTRRKMIFHVPSRGTVGLRGELIRQSRGDVIISSVFHGYKPHVGKLGDVRKGVLIASHDGVATTYALTSTEERGEMFIGPGQHVYCGMIVGEHTRGVDLQVNVTKTKKLTNIRAAGKDEFTRLTPPRIMALEDFIGYINEDELIEITPRQVRIRKSVLDPTKRKIRSSKD